MKLSTISTLADVDAEDWNTLAGDSNPFVQHDFLFALEKHDCLLPWGWQPAYQLVHENDELVGATPSYLKTNSYGEFVFDWAWADAYQRNAMQYYPKLVITIPYTPAKGPRLLTGHNENARTIKTLLVRGATALVETEKLSSAHWLFCENDDIEVLREENMLLRSDYQFHWANSNYESFDHYLSHLSSKKRKNIRRERRKMTDANINVEIRTGNELSEEQWHTLYHFYSITFIKKSGTATMTLEFFQAMAHKLVAIIALSDNKIIAGAICFRGKDTLYGRHWGCYEEYDGLHFEVCYYAGIDYCINEGLQYFEPGAQGEHKISRGFLPVQTRSAHWIKHPGFRQAIADFLKRETSAMHDYARILDEASPFRKS